MAILVFQLRGQTSYILRDQETVVLVMCSAHPVSLSVAFKVQLPES